MTLLVRDEADVVDANIRYHLARGVDYVIATDHRSVDGTGRILREHERAGHLRYMHEASDTYAQSAWVTRMARLAATDHQADWVINNDADEFWWPRSGDLRSSLASVHDAHVVEAPRSNFVPRPEPLGTWSDRMVVREIASRNAVGQPLPGKVCHRAHPAVVVAPGNHDVTLPDASRWAATPPIEILHFPMRSRAQMARKIRHAQAALRRDRRSGVGETWVRMAELQERGEFATWYETQELDMPTIEHGLESGSLVEDRRLQHFLEANAIHVASQGVVASPVERVSQMTGKLAASVRRITSSAGRR